jgi:UDP-4-amino-4,6-dideoxy-N-acetyl-beta-L-altrosamine N-acetyltransferase
MQIQKYGITLQRLEISDLELVRTWRNADHVRLNMQFQDLITPPMQIDWFQSLNVSKNQYFIIKKDAVAVGVVNIKDINDEVKTAEAGIFIGIKVYLDSTIPFLATISIMEYAFDILKLKSLKAKINTTNTKVILFNQSFGYKKEEQQRDEFFHYYTVTYNDFLLATEKWRGMLNKLNRAEP